MVSADDVPDSTTTAVRGLLESDPQIGVGRFVVEMRRQGIDPSQALAVLPVLLGLGQ